MMALTLEDIKTPLKVSPEEFLSAKMKDNIDASQGVVSRELTPGTVQRPMVRHRFGYTSLALFENRNPPSTEQGKEELDVIIDDHEMEVIHEDENQGMGQDEENGGDRGFGSNNDDQSEDNDCTSNK
eukprot:scaffold2563_cov124-Cylindrotheca_fusiformis.AAC.13